MNQQSVEFIVRDIVQNYMTGKVKSHSELFVWCNKNPRLFGAVMEKIVALKKDGAAREVSSGSDASTESASGQVDCAEPKEVSGVRTRSRAAKSIKEADCEVKPRKRVPKTIRFSGDGDIKGEEIVPRHRCQDYTEKGIWCLYVVWEQTKRIVTPVGLWALGVCLDGWKRLRG